MYIYIYLIHIAKKKGYFHYPESAVTYLTDRDAASALVKPIPLAKNIQHFTYGAKGLTLVNPNIFALYLC